MKTKALNAREDVKLNAMNPKNAPQTFPILPPELERFLHYHEKHKTAHRSYLAAGMLAALSTSICGKFTLKSDVTATLGETIGNQFIAAVGLSSDGKTSGVNVFTKPLQELDAQLDDEYTTRLRTYKNIKAIRDLEKRDAARQEAINFKPHPDGYDYNEPPEISKYIVNDFNLPSIKPILIENGKRGMGLLAKQDELDGFFEMAGRSSSEAGMLPTLCILWDGADWLTNRMGRTENGAFISGMTNVRKPRFCFIGGIQTGLLNRLLSDKNVQQGFAARFLIFAPDDVRNHPRKPLTAADKASLERHEKDWRQIIHAIHAAAPNIFELDEAATNAHAQFENEIADLKNHYRDTNETERLILYGKVNELMPRLALMLHAAKIYAAHGDASNAAGGMFQPNQKITAETILLAKQLALFFMGQIEKVLTAAESESAGDGLDKEPLNTRSFIEDLYRRFKFDTITLNRRTITQSEDGKKLMAKYEISEQQLDRLLNPKRGYFKRVKQGKYLFDIDLPLIDAELMQRRELTPETINN